MDPVRLTLAAAALVPAMFIFGPSSETVVSPAVADLGVEVTSTEVEQGCKITVKARNQGSRTAAISRDSQVRIRGGTWKKLGKSIWINAGQSRSWTYDLDFGCKVGRQYRFLAKQFDSNRNLLNSSWYTYPRRTFTFQKDFDIGDLNRLF